ncbi:MAG TPA: glycosyltransferase [Solirubrobacteraceae bacterium]|nr:glycosyltransferase [Solirubrobacteraceae bacterium]
MKLIIQIPCFNERDQLPETLRHLPRQVEGFDTVEWLVIDDGSTDGTIEVARACGVDHLVRLTNNKGLAAAFQAGLDTALKLGADVIVNTDADNQYEGADIPKLVAPILAGEADMVIGDRQVGTIPHFSAAKRRLQRLGSWVVRQASSTEIPDTTSGFRAYNREAALQVQAVSKFTYTLETIIQAGKLLVAVSHVPVRTNPKTRESRLFPSTSAYVRRNALSIFRIYSQYEPLKVFWSAALVTGVAALGFFVRFLVPFIENGGRAGHIQSLIAGAVLFNAAMLLAALGVIGDLLAAQRTLSQRTFERVRRIELALGIEPSHYERGGGRPAGQPAGDTAAPAGQPAGDTAARAAEPAGDTAAPAGQPAGDTAQPAGGTGDARGPQRGRPGEREAIKA